MNDNKISHYLLLFAIMLQMLANNVVQAQQIDRRAVVERHNIAFDRYRPDSPASVGNGEFAFTFDITGMQTFPSEAAGHLPLGTMAQWSWHVFPKSKAFAYSDTLRDYPAHGRAISYATDMRSEAAQAIRSNPHRFNLARISLRLVSDDGSLADVDDLKNTHQLLDLWSGIATSTFDFEGQRVRVETVAHPSIDAVSFLVSSPLVSQNRVAIEIDFAYPRGVWGPGVDDWDAAERHSTSFTSANGGAHIERILDETRYRVDVVSSGTVSRTATQHQLHVTSENDNTIETVVHFVRSEANRHCLIAGWNHTKVRQASATHWSNFWSNGGAIDLSESSDPRWRELERRIVLSQFLTAVNCAGSMPPQETGLVCNSWFGKSHLEMHWWHAAHFPLWGRDELLHRSLDWYSEVLPAAKRIAVRQGYHGARWPKMTGPHGVSSPSEVGELLIWQQPHPIYFAELAYRQQPTQETLERLATIVEETADFMADYAHFDKPNDRYVLGPVLIPAQECYDGRSEAGVMNPTFELAYWRWALRIAVEWQGRLGKPKNKRWGDVAAKIAKPHISSGVYTAIENPPFTRHRDHPSMLGALGILPEVGLIDRGIMLKTFEDVEANWQWSETWGWDYPMMAMTAARLRLPYKAIDSLLLDTQKNRYLPNGHCRQSDRLPIYLPANGGLLAAVAMMSGGWDGSEGNAPGFPKDGSWTVRHEGLVRMP